VGKFYITTPIYYTNDVPHIGHAYTTIAADVAARFHRLAGDDVWFLTGTDEHGLTNLRSAEKHGVTPQEWVDRNSEQFRRLWAFLNISHDDFIRTTEPRHKKVAAHIFQRLYDQGDIYLGTYEGWYCASCETYYPESELGPNRTCPIHGGRPVEWTAEQCYLFRLPKYQDSAIRHRAYVKRRNEVTGLGRSWYLRPGLGELIGKCGAGLCQRRGGEKRRQHQRIAEQELVQHEQFPGLLRPPGETPAKRPRLLLGRVLRLVDGAT